MLYVFIVMKETLAIVSYFSENFYSRDLMITHQGDLVSLVGHKFTLDALSAACGSVMII